MDTGQKLHLWLQRAVASRFTYRTTNLRPASLPKEGPAQPSTRKGRCAVDLRAKCSRPTAGDANANPMTIARMDPIRLEMSSTKNIVGDKVAMITLPVEQQRHSPRAGHP